MARLNRKLTDLEIKNAKPKDKPYKLYDEGGLRVVIRPTGTKTWQYPYMIQGKENVFTIGTYPRMGSSQARKLRDDVKDMLRNGQDPNQQKKSQHILHEYEEQNLFENRAREWFAKQTWKEKHAANIMSRLEKDVFPHIGKKAIGKVTRQEMFQLLQHVEARGALDVAKRINQYCTQIFEYALIIGIIENNPAMGLSKAIKAYTPEHRPYLKEKQLPEFLRKLEDYSGRAMIKLGMKLLMHTFVRPGELRGAKWEEFNIEKAEWRIPADRMKMGREHIVPLSTQALKIIEQLHPLTGFRPLLFPGIVHPREPISDVTLTKVLIILGYKGIASAHGMRATASTILNENGFKSDVIERQLAHIEQNKVRAAYNHSEYLAERREMMQWWGDYLSRIQNIPV